MREKGPPCAWLSCENYVMEKDTHGHWKSYCSWECRKKATNPMRRHKMTVRPR